MNHHEQSRPAFEVLHNDDHFLTRGPDGSYVSPEVQQAWNTWCRALNWAAEQAEAKPCGECHLKPGEICDICGKQDSAPAAPQHITGNTIVSKESDVTEQETQLNWTDPNTNELSATVTKLEPDPQQAGSAVEQRADEHFAGYNEAVEITPKPRIETHTCNFLGIEWVREQDYTALADELTEAQRREERLRGALENLYEASGAGRVLKEGEANRLHKCLQASFAALAETKEEKE